MTAEILLLYTVMKNFGSFKQLFGYLVTRKQLRGASWVTKKT